MAPGLEMQANQPEERRSSKRYPVGLDLRYKIYRNSTILQEGCGTTQDFSAEGVFFRPDRGLPAGCDVELWMDWPVLIDGGSFLHVTISGQIVRCTESGVAVRIAHSDFRPNSAKPTC